MDTSFLIQAIIHGCENQRISCYLDPGFDYLHGKTHHACAIHGQIRKQINIASSLSRVLTSCSGTDLAPPADPTFNTKSTCMHASQETSPDDYIHVPYSGSDHHLQTNISPDSQRPWVVIDIPTSSTTLSRERSRFGSLGRFKPLVTGPRNQHNQVQSSTTASISGILYTNFATKGEA